MNEHRREAIALNLGRLARAACYVSVIDAFAQFDAMHHRVVVVHDSYHVQVEEQYVDCLPLLDANDPTTKHEKNRMLFSSNILSKTCQSCSMFFLLLFRSWLICAFLSCDFASYRFRLLTMKATMIDD
jgi:hypothetical protein